MAVRLTGTSNLQEIDANGNAYVRTPQTETQAGFVQISSENDSGLVLGTRSVKSPETADDYRLRVGIDQTLFYLSFEGTNIARDRIQQNDTTATSAQASGFLTLNSGSSLVSGQGSNIRTYNLFPLYQGFPIYGECIARIVGPLATNAISEWGFGFCSGVTAQLTDGIFFRLIAGGTLRAIMTYNSTDTVVTNITTTNIPSRDGTGTFDITEANHYIITATADAVQYWINDTLVATQKAPNNQGTPTLACNQPFFGRVYNTGIPSTARQLGLGFISVSQGDMNSGRPYGHAVNSAGGGSYQIQPGTTSGPTCTRGAVATAGWPNSATARTAGTWTATSAPAINSLGGLWLSPAISTLASDADYPIFAYLNPAGSATLPGKNLYITGIAVGNTCATVAASTNSIVLAYAAGIGSTGTATNVTEAAAAVAARIIPLGQVGFAATAPIGTIVSGWTVDFSQAPLVCYPGTYVHFIVRPFGTVTSNTLVVAGSVTFIGYHA